MPFIYLPLEIFNKELAGMNRMNRIKAMLRKLS
jgi:hypothetical protein